MSTCIQKVSAILSNLRERVSSYKDPHETVTQRAIGMALVAVLLGAVGAMCTVIALSTTQWIVLRDGTDQLSESIGLATSCHAFHCSSNNYSSWSQCGLLPGKTIQKWYEGILALLVIAFVASLISAPCLLFLMVKLRISYHILQNLTVVFDSPQEKESSGKDKNGRLHLHLLDEVCILSKIWKYVLGGGSISVVVSWVLILTAIGRFNDVVDSRDPCGQSACDGFRKAINASSPSSTTFTCEKGSSYSMIIAAIVCVSMHFACSVAFCCFGSVDLMDLMCFTSEITARMDIGKRELSTDSCPPLSPDFSCPAMCNPLGGSNSEHFTSNTISDTAVKINTVKAAKQYDLR